MSIEIRIAPGELALTRAIEALPANQEPAVIHLAPGVYREKAALRRPYTTLQGSGADCTTILWDDGAKVPMPDGLNRGTFRTATLFTDGEHITLRGLSIVNAAPREQDQALALYADGDFFTCEDCILRSGQDTLFTAPLPPKEILKNGFIGPKQFAPRTPQRHTYRRCRIEGDVDFIFGGAAAWFEDCDVVSTAPGYATAASTPQGQAFGYVFSNCRFISGGAPEGSCYLGRPWREYAKTVLLNCTIGPHIKPEGWHDWDKPLFHTEGYYAEYGSGGPRAAYVHLLTAEEAQRYTYEAFIASL